MARTLVDELSCLTLWQRTSGPKSQEQTTILWRITRPEKNEESENCRRGKKIKMIWWTSTKMMGRVQHTLPPKEPIPSKGATKSDALTLAQGNRRIDPK